MAVPASYTEQSLAEYMHNGVLKSVGTVLGWTVEAGNYSEIVNDTILAYFDGPGDLAQATNIRQLRAMARVAVWSAVVEETTGDYDYENENDSLKRSQVNAQAHKALKEARVALESVLSSPVVTRSAARIKSVSLSNDVRF